MKNLNESNFIWNFLLVDIVSIPAIYVWKKKGLVEAYRKEVGI